MDRPISTLFFILLGFKSFSHTITTQHNSANYDITETLRTSVQEILQDIDKLTQLHKQPLFNFTYNSKFRKEPFICKITKTYSSRSSARDLYYNFITNEMRITIRPSLVYTEGTLRSLQNSENSCQFTNYLYINNDIELSKSPENNSNEKFSVHCIPKTATNFTKLYQYLDKPNNFHFPSMNNDEEYHFKSVCHSVSLQHFRDELEAYGKNVRDKLQHNTRTIFTSTCPNFLKNPQQYYYLIPNIPYICFNLRNITIRGLTNFVWLNKTVEEKENFGITLFIINIRGEMILDYGSGIKKPMKLIFSADDISIRVNLYGNRSIVEIRNYRVIRKEQNDSVTDGQSAIIIEHIELAIASSLMPSMTVWKRTRNKFTNLVHDGQNLSRKIFCELAQKADWKLRKNLLNQWFPFNDVEPTVIYEATNSNSFTNQTHRPTHEYHISFRNITIKLLSGIPDPKAIQCELPNNLKIIHDINATPIQKIRWDGNNGDGIDIKFHANFTSIKFSEIKPNSSNSNDACEFQLNNNENIKVDLASEQHTGEDEDLQLKKKIDTTLISMAKERFVRNVKPMVCLPFKICNQAAKMVDDFFLHFIDNVLKKCSLRRNK